MLILAQMGLSPYPRGYYGPGSEATALAHVSRGRVADLGDRSLRRAFARPLEASRFPIARASAARPLQRCNGSPPPPGSATGEPARPQASAVVSSRQRP